jgi:hypothetical protein
METLHEIIVGLLTNAIWSLGGFLIACIIKKATDSHGIGNETIATCYKKKHPLSSSQVLIRC